MNTSYTFLALALLAAPCYASEAAQAASAQLDTVCIFEVPEYIKTIEYRAAPAGVKRRFFTTTSHYQVTVDKGTALINVAELKDQVLHKVIFKADATQYSFNFKGTQESPRPLLNGSKFTLCINGSHVTFSHKLLLPEDINS